ncbi:hypothetical protein T492DRAFT_867479 [Pavlovales sp. CCMP2436]|nr:hypothetical protein T492DRAFT_867479 [Pavlovales sp. CCMP2436]
MLTGPSRPPPAGSYRELGRLPDNPTLNSLLQTLSDETMIEYDVIHHFIAGLAPSSLDGGGVVADPESAARFQRGLLELLEGGSTTRVEHDAYVSFWMECLRKIVQCTSWPIIDRQYASTTKYTHAMAVAGLSKRQRIDSDQAKRIVDHAAITEQAAALRSADWMDGWEDGWAAGIAA